MENEFRIRRIFLCAAVVFISVFLAGCLVAPHSFTSGEPIEQDKVKMIQPGKTTKDEIIQWFGVPNAIVKKGEKINPSSSPNPGSYYYGAAAPVSKAELSSDELYDLFSSKHKFQESDRIYYYTYIKSHGMTLGLPFFTSTDSSSVSDKLIILMDDGKGVVEDFIYRKQS